MYAVTMRRDITNHIGLFDIRFQYAGDFHMWLRIASHYDVVFIKMPLVARRVHANSESSILGVRIRHEQAYQVIDEIVQNLENTHIAQLWQIKQPEISRAR